eukprot:TRINITY_DN18121_c0_g1_i1.p2 TRINITY_DN18121_c0_g1~~TRINITY_DN18121_c0_g1_i1.p2  ORF type:complete len:316 (+),score=159.12 TRINITY_DN18121_c0_g1_i1:88-948(+)
MQHFDTFPMRWVQWDVLLLTPVVYLCISFFLRWFMRNRDPVSKGALKYPMLVYNWTQVAVSATMTYQLGKLVGIPNVFGVQADFTPHAEYWIFIHYLSKSLDFFDTFFICLRKADRQFSFLHVYHHATIGGIWGWLLQAGYGNGTGFYGAWINSLVHTVMYFHYGWVALGFTNPFKAYVTKLQIAQFYSCMMHASFVTIWDSAPEGHFPVAVCCIQLAYHVTMIALFTGFFKETYKQSAKVLKQLPAADITKHDIQADAVKESELQKTAAGRKAPINAVPDLVGIN